jgi:hypothetical protein
MDEFSDQPNGFFGGASHRPSTWTAEIVDALSGDGFGYDTTFLWRCKSCEGYLIAPKPSRPIIDVMGLIMLPDEEEVARETRKLKAARRKADRLVRSSPCDCDYHATEQTAEDESDWSW